MSFCYLISILKQLFLYWCYINVELQFLKYPLSSGTFKLTLIFTEDYPNKPPTVRFVSRMFHPNSMLELEFGTLYFFNDFKLNVKWDFRHLCSRFFLVYADGSICLDILQNQWSPIYDVAAILTSIQVPANSQIKIIASKLTLFSPLLIET